MFKTYCKTIPIAIFTVVLFGCGGEADEAKKLGFASVDEMKEAHAKGWHTQQQYHKDNPDIERKAEQKDIGDNSATSASSLASDGQYKGWKNFTIADGKFVIRYPEKLDIPKPDCEILKDGERCVFVTSETIVSFDYHKSDQFRQYSPAEIADASIKALERAGEWKLLEKKSLNVGGIDAVDVLYASTKNDSDRYWIRHYRIGDIALNLYGRSREGKYSNSRDDIHKFINSFSLAKAVDKENEKLPDLHKVNSPTKWRQGIEYQNFVSGPCSDKDNKICLTSEEYSAACSQAKGVTGSAIKMASMFLDSDTKQLVEGGRIANVTVKMIDSNSCAASVVAEGIISGNSARKSFGGRASAFKLDSGGDLQVSYIDMMAR